MGRIKGGFGWVFLGCREAAEWRHWAGDVTWLELSQIIYQLKGGFEYKTGQFLI